MTRDNGQKEVCRKCGISAKSVVKCSQTTAPECACMQMALVYAAQHAGEVQRPVSFQSPVQVCGELINDSMAKLALKGVEK